MCHTFSSEETNAILKKEQMVTARGNVEDASNWCGCWWLFIALARCRGRGRRLFWKGHRCEKTHLSFCFEMWDESHWQWTGKNNTLRSILQTNCSIAVLHRWPSCMMEFILILLGTSCHFGKNTRSLLGFLACAWGFFFYFEIAWLAVDYLWPLMCLSCLCYSGDDCTFLPHLSMLHILKWWDTRVQKCFCCHECFQLLYIDMTSCWKATGSAQLSRLWIWRNVTGTLTEKATTPSLLSC